MASNDKKETLAAACPDVELGDVLGEGGNARVYEGTSREHGRVAVKFFVKGNSKRFTRFKDEVLVVTTRLKDSPRVLPIFKHHLPDSLAAGDVPWYVMPAARRLMDGLRGQSWLDRLVVLTELADGLTELHALDVAHRDIKPDNLFELSGTYRFGDFGIAAFPERAGITARNEPMGPWGYMAPEMLSDPQTADVFKADVYSFAKTVWAVLTEERVPFGGHYAAHTPVGLSRYASSQGKFVVEPLDLLLERSTRISPAERPTAQEFAQQLKDALAVQADWRRANALQWDAAEAELLSGPGLIRAEWRDAAEIARVITALSRRHGLNHCLLPRWGGLEVSSATVCEGGAMLALHVKSSVDLIVKPIRLTLERFTEGRAFNYAVLETADTEPLGTALRVGSEEAEPLLRLDDFDYVVRDPNDEEPPTSPAAKPCERYFKGGVFVISPTSGIFNRAAPYDGTWNALGRDRLREEIDRYFEHEKQGQLALRPWQPVRKVRLLEAARAVGGCLPLRYLSNELLLQLIHADDALVPARQQERGLDSMVRRISLAVLHSAEASPEERVASDLLSQLTAEQRAEYLALVQVGRGRAAPADVHARTDELLEEGSAQDPLETLGYGQLRRMLSRFGIEAPPVRPRQAGTSES